MSDHTNPPDNVLVEMSGDEMEQVQGGDDAYVTDEDPLAVTPAVSGYIRVKKLNS